MSLRGSPGWRLARKMTQSEPLRSGRRSQCNVFNLQLCVCVSSWDGATEAQVTLLEWSTTNSDAGLSALHPADFALF